MQQDEVQDKDQDEQNRLKLRTTVGIESKWGMFRHN